MAIWGHDHKEIKGILSAKMSIPFGVALALKTGNAGLRDYNVKNLSDQEIIRLTNVVRMVEDSEIASWLPNKRAARVTIVSGKETFTACVEYPKGDPENPLTESEINEKNQ
jgi:2-methylcitrate dehydratase PrpD